jgi:hypothetical protein
MYLRKFGVRNQWIDPPYSPFCVTAKVTKLIGLTPPLFLSPINYYYYYFDENIIFVLSNEFTGNIPFGIELVFHTETV